MGRPPKYKSKEEQQEARRNQKRAWYSSHREIVRQQRARKRLLVVNATNTGTENVPTSSEASTSAFSPPPEPLGRVDFSWPQPDVPSVVARLGDVTRNIDNFPPLFPPNFRPQVDASSFPAAKRLYIPGYIPSTLSEELVSAHQRASNIAELSALCIYWRRTIRSFSRGHFVELARTVFDDLLEMSDDDEVKFDAYAALVDVLDDTEDLMHDILRRALNADPSGRGSTHHFACQTYKKVEKISEVLQEMIYFRRDGLECLIRNAQQGALEYRFM